MQYTDRPHTPRPTPPQRAVLLVVLLALVLGSVGCATESELQKKAVKDGQYHFQLGSNYFAEQMIPQALRELLVSIENDPKNADALHLLGFIYMGRRDYNRAIEYYQRAIEARPDFYICMNNLGTAYLAAERWEDAVGIYEELINKPMYNTPELAYNNLGWALYKLNQQRRAADAFEMAVFLQPRLCLAHNNLGLVREQQGNPVGALRSFHTAIEKCPTYAEPHFHMGLLLAQRGDPSARLYLERCYELGSDSSWGDRCRSYLEVAQ